MTALFVWTIQDASAVIILALFVLAGGLYGVFWAVRIFWRNWRGTACPYCNGTGAALDDRFKCPYCSGTERSPL